MTHNSTFFASAKPGYVIDIITVLMYMEMCTSKATKQETCVLQ